MADFKQWRQSLRVQSKKIQVFQKQLGKLLPFSMTTDLKTQIEAWHQDQQQNINNRFKEETSIFNTLSAIKAGVDEFRNTLKFFERKDQFLLKIQNISEDVLNRMDTFKGQMAKDFQKYAFVEEGLVKELDIFQIKVNHYQRNQTVPEEPALVNLKQRANKTALKAEEVRPAQVQAPILNDNEGVQKAILIIEDEMRQKTREVEDMDLQMRGLGKYLGWPEEDHNNFLMLWNRRKNNNYFQFEEECFEQLKTYTMDQIGTHIDKQKKLLELNDKRKELLYEYKLLKEKKRELELQLIERKEREERIQANKARKEVDRVKEEKETKEKLTHWKLMKEAQKEIEQRQKLLLEEKKREEVLNRKRELNQKKVVVAEWKEIKQQEKEQTEVVKRPRSAVNKETIERIRKKQDELLLKKMEILKVRQLKEQQKARKEQIVREKKFVQFNHVKSKLEEKTTTIKEKQRNKFDGTNPKEADTFGGNLGIIHSRAVPSWRQGL